METVDEAVSLDLILAKIVAAIAKFYKKQPAGLFKSECHNNTTCEKEKNPSGSQNLRIGSSADIQRMEEASAQELDQTLVEGRGNSSRRGESWEEREDLMNKDALGDSTDAHYIQLILGASVCLLQKIRIANPKGLPTRSQSPEGP